MEKQQTAVEYAIQEIEKLAGIKIARDEDIIIKAKEMEKKQIENAYRIGSANELTFGENKAENYYNETFKSE